MVAGQVNRFVIEVMPEDQQAANARYYTLVAQPANFALGLDSVRVAHGSEAPVEFNSTETGAAKTDSTGEFKVLEAVTVYDKMGNPFTYYTLNVGAEDKWAELTITPTNMANAVALRTDEVGYRADDRAGIRTRYNNDNQAVFTSNTEGVTGSSGKGHFSLALDELTWLSKTDPYTNVTFKEVYVPVEVSTGTYTQEYIIHLVRVNNDNSLRAINVETPDGADNDYDNEYTDPKKQLGAILAGQDEKGNDIYRIMVDEINTIANNIIIRATDDAAMVSVSTPNGQAPNPVPGDRSQVTIRRVDLTNGEMTRFEIKVRAEDGYADQYKTSYLEIYRVNDDVGLKDVYLSFDYKGQVLDVHGVPQMGEDGKVTYVFLLSTEYAEPVKDATLTAIANRQAALVQIQGNTAAGWGQDTRFYDSVDTSTIADGVTVTSSNGLHSANYDLKFVVVDLELMTVDVDGESCLVTDDKHGFYIETVDGVSCVVYYAIVDEEVSYVTMEVEANNSPANERYKDQPDDSFAHLTVSELEAPAVQPTDADGSRVFRKTQRISDGERSQFEILVGNYADLTSKPYTGWMTSTKYLRIYRNSSDTRPQTLTVYYVDETGKTVAVEATLDENGEQYSAFVPEYVNQTDLRVIGPSDLSYVSFPEFMDTPVRNTCSVKDFQLRGDETHTPLYVRAVDGTEKTYDVVIYREDSTLQSVIVDGVEAEKRAEPIVMTDEDGTETEHILYEALATDPDLADVLVKATSSRALVNAGRSDGEVDMPSGQHLEQARDLALRRSQVSGQRVWR